MTPQTSRWWHIPVGIFAMIAAIFVSGWIINTTLSAIEGGAMESLLNWISQAYLWLAGAVVVTTLIVAAVKK